MATLKELVYNIRMQIKDYRSDDIKLTDRHIEFMIGYIRAKLIRQDIQKIRDVSNNYEQELPMVSLNYLNASNDDLLYTGNKILVTDKLPKFLDVNGKILISSITGIDGSLSIDVVSFAQAKKKRFLKYASKRASAYYDNRKIHIEGCNSELSFINITGVFEDPTELENIMDENGEPLYNRDKDPYPISGHMIDMMNSIIKSQELEYFLQLAEDKVNDGQNNL